MDKFAERHFQHPKHGMGHRLESSSVVDSSGSWYSRDSHRGGVALDGMEAQRHQDEQMPVEPLA